MITCTSSGYFGVIVELPSSFSALPAAGLAQLGYSFVQYNSTGFIESSDGPSCTSIDYNYYNSINGSAGSVALVASPNGCGGSVVNGFSGQNNNMSVFCSPVFDGPSPTPTPSAGEPVGTNSIIYIIVGILLALMLCCLLLVCLVLFLRRRTQKEKDKLSFVITRPPDLHIDEASAQQVMFSQGGSWLSPNTTIPVPDDNHKVPLDEANEEDGAAAGVESPGDFSGHHHVVQVDEETDQTEDDAEEEEEEEEPELIRRRQFWANFFESADSPAHDVEVPDYPSAERASFDEESLQLGAAILSSPRASTGNDPTTNMLDDFLKTKAGLEAVEKRQARAARFSNVFVTKHGSHATKKPETLSSAKPREQPEEWPHQEDLKWHPDDESEDDQQLGDQALHNDELDTQDDPERQQAIDEFNQLGLGSVDNRNELDNMLDSFLSTANDLDISRRTIRRGQQPQPLLDQDQQWYRDTTTPAAEPVERTVSSPTFGQFPLPQHAPENLSMWRRFALRPNPSPNLGSITGRSRNIRQPLQRSNTTTDKTK